MIGVEKTGLQPLGNRKSGIALLNGSNNNIIGGTADGMGNVISANGEPQLGADGHGVSIRESIKNELYNNIIGLAKDGTTPMPNEYDGVNLSLSANENKIGAANAGNTISGNKRDGVSLDQVSRQNRLLGNRIGTDSAGNAAKKNHRYGVFLNNSSRNNVGGSNEGGERHLRQR